MMFTDSDLADLHIAWLNKNFPRKTFSDEEWEELSLYTWLAWRDSYLAWRDSYRATRDKTTG